MNEKHIFKTRCSEGRTWNLYLYTDSNPELLMWKSDGCDMQGVPVEVMDDFLASRVSLETVSDILDKEESVEDDDDGYTGWD